MVVIGIQIADHLIRMSIISLTLERFMPCPYSYFLNDTRRSDTTPPPAFFHFSCASAYHREKTQTIYPTEPCRRRNSLRNICDGGNVRNKTINRFFSPITIRSNPVCPLRRSNPKPRQEIDHMHGVCRHNKEY